MYDKTAEILKRFGSNSVLNGKKMLKFDNAHIIMLIGLFHIRCLQYETFVERRFSSETKADRDEWVKVG